MYLTHYGLTEPPFSITPDPRFVFLSERHRDALAHLLFGVDQGGGGGFVQLTGEVGTGKTTLCRLLLEQLTLLQSSTPTRVALVLNPQLSPVELLETICEELRLDLDLEPGNSRRGSRKSLVDLLNAYLLEAYAQGLRVVLIIDEAQNLSIEALEQVRLLTNLETPTQKLLQILLLGQPELRTMLAREDLRQLAQRITARYHLTPLDADETGEYLHHRWRVAGGQRFPFTANAVKRIHRHAGGVPRLINIIAERALLAGYAHDETSVSERWVDRAAFEALAPKLRRWPHGGIALATVAMIGAVVAAMLWLRSSPSPVAAEATAAAPSGVAAIPPRSPPAAATAAVPQIDDEALSRRLRAADPSPLPAWRALLALWQLPAAGADAVATGACTAPVAKGVYCLRGLAGLDKLAIQGRPALLRLRADGDEAWALLLGADAVNVRLQLGDHAFNTQAFDTDRIALERVWAGEYATLWRAPAAMDSLPTAPLGSGARGPLVDWVHERLQPRFLSASDGPPQVDAAMRDAVRRYQRARGLTTDGVIGPETLMALSSGEVGPRLLRVLE